MSVAPASDPPRCRCGHDKTNIMVSPVPHYTGWAVFWVYFMGVSHKPERLDYQCRVCKQIIESTTDDAVLSKFV